MKKNIIIVMVILLVIVLGIFVFRGGVREAKEFRARADSAAGK